jgi:molecular chaperone DnaK
MTKLIERNTTIPARREEIFSTADDNQTAVDIVVLQGEREMARDNRMLGRFRLEGISPAPRGIPQIKVAFDIDANGILDVTATDMGTGKKQTVTIKESTSLDQNEIERMVQDAEKHATEDKQRRETIDARHQADSLAYQLERTLQEIGDKVPLHEKSRSEQLIEETHSAVQDESATKERYQQLAGDLQQALHMISSVAYQQAGAPGGPKSRATEEQPRGPDEDVIDAEYKEH